MFELSIEKAQEALKAATPEARQAAKEIFTRAAGIAGEWFGSGDLPAGAHPTSLEEALAMAGALDAALVAKIQAKRDAHDLAQYVFQVAQHIALAAALAAV